MALTVREILTHSPRDISLVQVKLLRVDIDKKNRWARFIFSTYSLSGRGTYKTALMFYNVPSDTTCSLPEYKGPCLTLKTPVKVWCSCLDFRYRRRKKLKKFNALYGGLEEEEEIMEEESKLKEKPQRRKPRIDPSLVCKHVLACLQWLQEKGILSRY